MKISKKVASLFGIGVVVVFTILFVFSSGTVNSSYQAVFLANNQVYFGKLTNTLFRYPVLKDVYYLRVAQDLQPQNPNTPSSQIQLVKLGSEIHGPTAEMKINRDQILFIENLKNDSQIVKAILDQKRTNEAKVK
jgi:hypothetical protein